jgi:hypothetical protein
MEVDELVVRKAYAEGSPSEVCGNQSPEYLLYRQSAV